MVSSAKHGGGCCGAYHIYDFSYDKNYVLKEGTLYNATNVAYEDNIDYAYSGSLEWDDNNLEDYLSEGTFLGQIILNQKQIQNKSYQRVLTDFGYRFVTSWVNINTGYRCYLFVHHHQFDDKESSVCPTGFLPLTSQYVRL